MTDLITAWAEWTAEEAPFILKADVPTMSSPRSLKASVICEGWEEAYNAPDFAAPDDTRLHLGLLPQPFVGDIRHAEVYILLLNPGLGPTDYYGEYQVPAYRDAMMANLRQDFPKGNSHFLFLDPQFSWHGGFQWWHGKFARLIEVLSRARNEDYSSARDYLSSKIASIELFPYHSAGFRDAGHWLGTLPSTNLAREFVSDHLLPDARAGRSLVVVTRKAAEWGIPEQPGVVVYSGAEARAAHLTPMSRGGSAIIDFLR